MSKEEQQKNRPEEVDLGIIFQKLKNLLKSFLKGIVMVLQFFLNHKIVLTILLAIGIGSQFLLKMNNEKIYLNEFLVRTNFGSTDYLYSKVESIDKKLDSNDTIYLKNAFGKNYKRVTKVEVSPVTDVYRLVNQSTENKEIFKLLYKEYGDISFLEEEININQYPTHRIKILVEGKKNNKVISTKLHDYLSENPHFTELKFAALQSYKEQLEENMDINSQIDSIIKNRKNDNGTLPRLDNNIISFTGSQNLNQLLKQKQSLLNDNFRLRTLIINNQQLLKIVDSSFAIYSEEKNSINYILSFLLFFAYCIIYFLKFVYNRMIRFIEN